MRFLRKRLPSVLVLPALVCTACTSTTGAETTDPSNATQSSRPTAVSSPGDPSPSSPDTPQTPVPPLSSSGSGQDPRPEPGASTFRPTAALRTVRFLAERVGPREASSASYRRAATEVQQRFEAQGYRVQRQRFRVPAGNSWGVDVPSGTTWNVIATTPGFNPATRHLVVGAHLDTVPQAPGAEDNASGIAVLLELSRLAAIVETRLPVMFVAFGGEEPRGVGDAMHHFGSRAMVARMSAADRSAMVGMVSMDRVGVGTVVPVCAGGLWPPALRTALLRAAHRAEVKALACVNSSSDHWSFELAGMRSARVGGTSYAEYHSAEDRPSVVDPQQLAQVARLMVEWITG